MGVDQFLQPCPHFLNMPTRWAIFRKNQSNEYVHSCSILKVILGTPFFWSKIQILKKFFLEFFMIFCFYSNMKVWLQILRTVPKSSIFSPNFGTHQNPKADFVRKWEFFFTYLPQCVCNQSFIAVCYVVLEKATVPYPA